MLHGFGWTFTAGAVAVVVAAMFGYVARLQQKRYVRFWAAGWSAFAVCVLAASFTVTPGAVLLPAFGRLAASAGLLGGNSDFLANRASKIVRRLLFADLAFLLVPLFASASRSALVITAVASLQLVCAGVMAVALRRRVASAALMVATAVAALASMAVQTGSADWAAEVFGLMFVVAAMFGVIFEEERDQTVATMQEVERLAFHDALTDLPNRLLFMDHAGVEFAHAKRSGAQVAIAFIDLDRFKLVNDTFGHDGGDDVLRAVGGRLREALREDDTIARMGGDEFTVLLPGIRRMDDVTRIADKLLDVFRVPLQVGDSEVMITASIGISLFPDDAVDPEALVRNADSAMYRAKERGGENYQMYTQSLSSDSRKELETETRLRLALARNEFVLHYQPRVDASMERVVAFEALVRWNDPERGLVMPGEFIHIAESSGIIIGIGRWVLKTACHQVKEWHRRGRDVYVSVNVSPRQFHHHDLNAAVAEALHEAGLPAKFLELEVDESCVMNNAEASMRILSDLKHIGVRVLISHFGTGYSSLRNLRRFPIDGLKLDRSFSSGNDRSLATAALGMAKALQLKVIGEGVETNEDAEFLRLNACDDIQGFLFSAAVPAEQCGRFFDGPMVSARHAPRLPAQS